MTRLKGPKKLRFFKMLGRAVVTLIIAFPILGMLTIAPDGMNPYGLFVVASLIPFTIFGFLLFSVIDIVCLKLRLYDRIEVTEALQ